MIAAGFKLMVLGMLVVFVYLILMIFLINAFSKLLAPFTKREKEAQGTPPKPGGGKPPKKDDSEQSRLAAAVVAAISAYRKSRS